MTSQGHTAILIHVPTEWATTNYRFFFRELAEELPEEVHVLCVNRPVDMVVGPVKHTGKFLRRIWRTHYTREGSRLHVLTPRIVLHELLADRFTSVTSVNRVLMRHQLRRALLKLTPTAVRVIQWIHHPVQQWALDALPDAASIYMCYDEYTRTWDGRPRDRVWRQEQPLLRKADLTLATSETLVAKRSHLARRIGLIPNGIATSFCDRAVRIDERVARIPRPRVGYVGRLYNLLDYTLLEQLAARRREWSFVFIGSIESERTIKHLRALPNVHILGRCAHENLPGLIEGLDVGLMPLIPNAFTHASHPHKMFEYMSRGVPVVATDLKGIMPYSDRLSLVPGRPVDFERAIAATLAGSSENQSERLRSFASQYTWTNICRRTLIPLLRDTFDF